MPYEDDDISAESNVKTVIDQMIERNVPVVVVDTLNTSRWDEMDLEPFRCRGDMAIYGNDKGVMDSLRQWAHSTDNRLPRCVAFLNCRNVVKTFRQKSSRDFVRQFRHAQSLSTKYPQKSSNEKVK